MDDYTRGVKKWLDDRFRHVTPEGVFFAHQPIYGFRKGYCEPGCLDRYQISYEILRSVSQLAGESFLDVGGAEGYKAALVGKRFNLRVRSSDLSGEACNRAREIYGIEADETDSHALPYPDGAFDIVLSSESIEHVHEYHAVVDELIRVAAKAVIITVPHESPEEVQRNIDLKIPHGHIHAFHLGSFDHLKSRGFGVEAARTLHPMTLRLSAFIEGAPKPVPPGRWPLPYRAFNSLVPVFRSLLGRRAAAFCMRLDPLLCRLTGKHRGLVFTIAREGARTPRQGAGKVTPGDVLDFRVPPYRLPETVAIKAA